MNSVDGAVEIVLALFGPSARLHHVGLAVREIAAAGIVDLDVTHDPVQRVRVAFVSVGGARIEMIEPAGADSPVAASVQKGNRLLHLCYEVDDIHEAMSAARRNAFKVVHEPTSAAAFDGRPIAWVYHPLWGLFELLQRAL